MKAYPCPSPMYRTELLCNVIPCLCVKRWTERVGRRKEKSEFGEFALTKGYRSKHQLLSLSRRAVFSRLTCQCEKYPATSQNVYDIIRTYSFHVGTFSVERWTRGRNQGLPELPVSDGRQIHGRHGLPLHSTYREAIVTSVWSICSADGKELPALYDLLQQSTQWAKTALALPHVQGKHCQCTIMWLLWVKSRSLFGWVSEILVFASGLRSVHFLD